MNLSRYQLFSLMLLVATASLLALGCRTRGGLKNDIFEKRDARYHVGKPGGNWKPVSLTGVDLAWVSQDGSSLMVNSECKESDDPSLVALTWQLVIGMTDQELLEQKTVPSSGREALESIISAKLDGVTRKMKVFVLKRNGCIFDIILAAAPERFEDNLQGYDAVVKSFDAGANS